MAGTEELNNDVPLEKKLDELYKLIEGIEIAMFTTRRADGRLVSRPMATQKREPGADLWFVTDIESTKVDELVADPNVALAYYNAGPNGTWKNAADDVGGNSGDITG